MLKKLAFTGHRPDKLGGSYDIKDHIPLCNRIRQECIRHIEDHDVSIFIQGLALGFDMFSARVVIKLKETYPQIKLWSAIPCLGHPNKWNEKSRLMWGDIVAQSDALYLVTPEPYKPYLMQVRNQFMVDRADYLIGCWDGTDGGTGNCVKYAHKKLKEENITIINPNDL